MALNDTGAQNFTLVKSIFDSNVTLLQVTKLLNISISNLTHQSAETQMKIFDLYEAYRTKEKEQLMAYKFVAYILGTLIILSNLSVVISSGLILKKGQQPKSTYLLLGNVSLADTIIGFSIVFGTLVNNSSNSNPLCIFQIGMLVCPAMVSIFSVGLIAIDRYIYILHGMYYQRWFNTTKVRIGIMCIWMIGIIISSLPAMGWTGKSFTNYRCWYIALFPRALLVVLSIVVLSVIIMVCVLYIMILHSAVKTVDRIRKYRKTNTRIAYISKAYTEECRRMKQVSKTQITITVSTETETTSDSIQMRKLSKNSYAKNIDRKLSVLSRKISRVSTYYGQARAMNSHPSKLKAVKTVMIVILCFVGTWVPYYVTVIVYVKCDIMKHGYECLPLEMLAVGPLFYLGVCNSLCDPLIYAWRHSGFKRTLGRMYRKYVWSLKFRI